MSKSSANALKSCYLIHKQVSLQSENVHHRHEKNKYYSLIFGIITDIENAFSRD